jgi:hypothetical protein
MAYRAMHKGRESANTPEYICEMNNHFVRSLQHRYEDIYYGASLTAMIPRAEPAKVTTMITDGLGIQVVREEWGKLAC